LQAVFIAEKRRMHREGPTAIFCSELGNRQNQPDLGKGLRKSGWFIRGSKKN